jgi:pilus assembly protein Flp/PilA
MNWKNMVRRIWLDQSGATAIEYGLIASLIVIAIMVSLQSVAGAAIDMWIVVAASLSSVM